MRQTNWLITSVAEAGLNPGPPDFKSGALTTGPRHLRYGSKTEFAIIQTCIAIFMS